MQQNKKTDAQQGWQQMKNLLNEELPVKQSNTHNKRKYSALLLLLLISSCGVYKFWINNSNTNSIVNHSKKANEATSFAQSKTNVADTKKFVAPIKKSSATTKTSATQVNDLTTAAKSYSLQKRKYSAPTKNSFVQEKNYSTQNTKHSTATKKDIIQQNKFIPSSQSVVVTSKPQNSAPTTANITESINPSISSVSTTQQNSDTPKIAAATQKDIAQPLTKVSPTAKSNTQKTSLGIEYSIPFAFNQSSIQNNLSYNKTLVAFLPSLFINKKLSKKSSITLKFNPYSQYLLNNVIATNNFTSQTQTASNSINTTTQLQQIIYLTKVIGIELNAAYEYALSKKWKAIVGVGNTFVTNAVANNIITQNNSSATKNTVFALTKTDENWKNIRNNFITINAGISYQFKKIAIGTRLVKAITPIYNNAATPLNYQVFGVYNIF